VGFTDIEIESLREYTAEDAEGAGLGDVLQKYGKKGAEEVGFASVIVRAVRPVLSGAEGPGGSGRAFETPVAAGEPIQGRSRGCC